MSFGKLDKRVAGVMVVKVSCKGGQCYGPVIRGLEEPICLVLCIRGDYGIRVFAKQLTAGESSFYY